MKLIKIQGDISLIKAKRPDENWSQRDGNNVAARAIIEFESCGLPRQERYVIYKHSKNNRYYCNVQRHRVYLDEIGLNQ